ncbi:cell division protein ZapE [Pseudomonas sp. nanlin1]|uniref:cell division protein ZapE n=1 Tax=Pseudomonas sp. nanlin1 TaxID=3040605 RepID=UPI00388DD37C
MPEPLDSPLAAYRRACQQPGFHPDPAQSRAVDALQSCFAALSLGPAQGVYLWGPVGRGKTWLMDAFYQCLTVPARRQHFHHFMGDVHRRLALLHGTPEPLAALAAQLAVEIRVLCFDEFFVSDIADAIILGRLLQAMFAAGVTVVLTSNQAPRQLYADGFNRERFLPAIAAIERHMLAVAVDGEQDHRLHPGAPIQRYWQRPPGQPSKFAELFAELNTEQLCSTGPLAVGHRLLQVERAGQRVLWCQFAELCQRPFAAMDFMQLCDRFEVILLSSVPCLSAEPRPAKIARGTEDAALRVAAGDRALPALSVHDDSVRRFIALVDECYDRRVPLYLEAEVALPALYSEGYLAFAFRRTLSRLQEMQSGRFASAQYP